MKLRALETSWILQESDRDIAHQLQTAVNDKSHFLSLFDPQRLGALWLGYLRPHTLLNRPFAFNCFRLEVCRIFLDPPLQKSFWFPIGTG